MSTKDIFLIIVIIALAGLSYYLYSGVAQCKAIATDLGVKLQECGDGVEQLQSGLEQCTTQARQCQGALATLQQTCAPLLPTE